jgi:phosphoglycerate dehydrogenase-like enzyme
MTLAGLIDCYMLCRTTGLMQKEAILREKAGTPYGDLKGRTPGLVGVGRLGRRVAASDLSKRIRVVGHDPHVTRLLESIALVGPVGHQAVLRKLRTWQPAAIRSLASGS